MPEIRVKARLNRHGYNAKVLCELLNAKPREIRALLRGELAPDRTQELQDEIWPSGLRSDRGRHKEKSMNLAAEQLQIAALIDYMLGFKRLMDKSSRGEMDELFARFPGS